MKKNITFLLSALILIIIATSTISCKGKNNSKSSNNDEQKDVSIAKPVGPNFNEDSAYTFIAAQCKFGERIMNSDAHEKCRAWIVKKFKEYGCTVKEQNANLKGYDGTILRATNIIAQYNPNAKKRILICAHWDSRPWADNDPDSSNHKKPVMAANDGASGVAVMIELSRILNKKKQPLNIGIDFVCFDAEDWGVPSWEHTVTDAGESWALGAQYFADNYYKKTKPLFGILLDMVGGEGAQFYREGMSMQYAPDVVERVWNAAKEAGYESFFPDDMGGMITDDHIPINKKAGIPTIDVIPYYPDCQQSSFGPTWHTIYDTIEHIDKNSLKAVGQTMIQVIYTYK
ncbi:peptidase, M28 family [Prevotella amnii]|uniref:Peptidase, M28 family n=1 Tax=Prevotella amnii TaxID=419005 RepID=A0A134BN88_9BACT|nr:M28 family peptidase [Prevotella amnii]KXB81404.1 peptidase, M28 family [Prevotella amnii]